MIKWIHSQNEDDFVNGKRNEIKRTEWIWVVFFFELKIGNKLKQNISIEFMKFQLMEHHFTQSWIRFTFLECEIKWKWFFFPVLTQFVQIIQLKLSFTCFVHSKTIRAYAMWYSIYFLKIWKVKFLFVQNAKSVSKDLNDRFMGGSISTLQEKMIIFRNKMTKMIEKKKHIQRVLITFQMPFLSKRWQSLQLNRLFLCTILFANDWWHLD